MSIILQFYPNGEFTQGVDTARKRKSRPECISDEMHRCKHSPVAMSTLVDKMNAEMRPQIYAVGELFTCPMGYEYEYLGENAGQHHWAIVTQDRGGHTISTDESPEKLIRNGQLIPLNLVHQTVEFSQNPPSSRKKCLKMTSSMARNIRNACYLLETQYGKDSLSFLTLTLPDLSDEGLQACAENWGRMVDQFLKWLRDRMMLGGIPLEYVYCTEIQTKRREKYGHEALHLHLLFRGNAGRRKPWVVSPKQCRKAWARCIKSVCSEPFKDCSLENLQRIKRNAGAYMSKYLSKGTRSSDQGGSRDNGLRFRGHWGGMGRGLSQLIKRGRTRIGGATGDWKLANMLTTGLRRGLLYGHLAYYREGFICTNANKSDSERLGFVVAVGCLRQSLIQGGLGNLIEYVYSIADQLVN